MSKVQVLTQKEKLALEEYSKNGFNISKAVLSSYNCSSLKSASSIGTRIKKKLEKVRQQALDSRTEEQIKIQAFEKIPELDSNINASSILNRINKIAETDRNGATRLKALELLGKWSEMKLFKDVSEVQSTPPDDKTEHDLDAEFKLLAESRREPELVSHEPIEPSSNPA